MNGIYICEKRTASDPFILLWQSRATHSLTLEQVTDILNRKRVLGNPREIKEVKNAYDAYEEILTFNPYSIKYFLKAHVLFNG